jgi:zinc transport system ATP-binding protein
VLPFSHGLNAASLSMKPLLIVKDLEVVLDGKKIITGLSFELQRGDNLAIIGPNGSGKTVLIRALLGIVPFSGQLMWAPDVKFGYVPQKVDADRHLPLSLRDLLRAKERVLRLPPTALEGLCDTIALSSEILDAPIGRLSGGQFQKALIAFALLGSPNLLIFDEPTASLDQLTEERIYDVMQRLQQKFGLTFIVVSHDLTMVYRYANKVLCLNQQGLCFGPPREVLTPEALRALYGEHHQFYQHHHPDPS